MSKKELTLNIDTSALDALGDEFGEKFQKRLDKSISLLTAQAWSHIVEQAQAQLHSRRELYLDNLSAPTESEPGIWVITLYEKAVWIDDGQAQYDMKKIMLNSSKAKMGKNGRYVIIPFKHSKSPSQRTEIDKQLVGALKTELAKRGGFFKKIETDSAGKPLLGRIHSFNTTLPKQNTLSGLGQHGPSGMNFSAHPRSIGQAGPSGRPFLYGVRVYQRESPSASGAMKVKKDIFTFRTISDHSDSNSWIHPAMKGVRIFESTYDWIDAQWDKIESELWDEFLPKL